MTPSNNWDGKERRSANVQLEERVRMLEELERAGAKSRRNMHEQIEEIRADQKELKETMQEGFKEVAGAINNVGITLSGFEASAGKCPCPSAADPESPCPKNEMPWVKQWLTWVGAGEVALAGFVVTWLLTH